MNDLATIQNIKSVRPCPDSDNLDIVQILGWQVVTKRNEFKENDLVVYIVIDTILPEHPEFEFLRNKGFKIKPIKLRGQESAGIAFPISLLSKFGYDFKGPLYEGLNVTDVIGVKHYEKPLPTELAGDAVGMRPSCIIMTDELNLRTYPDALTELYGRPYYITRKDDGSSGTYFIKNSEFGVCSRNIQLKHSETNGFWRISKKYNIENIIREYFKSENIAIQGEVVGPGIQDNHLGLKELEFHLFNIFDINNRTYHGYDAIVKFCNETKIPMVTLINDGSAFGYTLMELLTLSNSQVYLTGKPAEGIVIRPKEGFTSKILQKSWSGKVLNEKYDEDKKRKK